MEFLALVSRLRIAARCAARSHGNPETKGHEQSLGQFMDFAKLCSRGTAEMPCATQKAARWTGAAMVHALNN
jgi:hypothetical protein